MCLYVEKTLIQTWKENKDTRAATFSSSESHTYRRETIGNRNDIPSRGQSLHKLDIDLILVKSKTLVGGKEYMRGEMGGEMIQLNVHRIRKSNQDDMKFHYLH